MEYGLIILLQLLGISFHVMQKVISIGDKFANLTPSQIFGTFFKEDWDTLIVSALVLCVNVTFYFIVDYYKVTYFTEWPYFLPVGFGCAFFFGYAGQRLIYKYFGSAEKFLDKQITDRLN